MEPLRPTTDTPATTVTRAAHLSMDEIAHEITEIGDRLV